MTVDAATAAFVLHLLSAHINVPEKPVRLEMGAEIRGFSGYRLGTCASIKWDDGWVMRLDPACWRSSRQSRREWILAHELCHAVYDYNLPAPWPDLAPAEQKWRHKRVDECADTAIRHHRQRINH